MLENYTQTLQDQIGQLSKLLGAQPSVQQPQALTTSVNSYDCVDGIEGAREFQQKKLLSGAKHIVWDTQKDVFYVLQKDANGTPARIKICPFTIELEPTMEDMYVSKDDFNALVARLDQILSEKQKPAAVKEAKTNG